MTPEEINQVKELITSALSEAMSKMLSKTTENAKTKATEVSDPLTRLKIQMKRSELSNRLAELGLKPEYEAAMEKQLRELPRTIPWDADLQEILDNFDFLHVHEKAHLCGFKYYIPILGREDVPTVEILIQDAFEMADKLRDCKCGRLQRGRLVLSKFWDEENNESWYTLGYFIEYQENY